MAHTCDERTDGDSRQTEPLLSIARNDDPRWNYCIIPINRLRFFQYCIARGGCALFSAGISPRLQPFRFVRCFPVFVMQFCTVTHYFVVKANHNQRGDNKAFYWWQMTFGILHADDRSVRLGYLGELCAVHRDGRPSIIRILDRVCAVSDTQTCEEVHIDATNFSVNPSFACKVVVSVGQLITPLRVMIVTLLFISWHFRIICFVVTIGATTTGTGGDWFGDQQCIGPPNVLAVVFKKQEISKQVVTRMQDLASEFSKIFRGWPSQHPTPSPAFGRAHGASAPVLGPKPWYPKFSAVVAPL